MPHMLGLFCEKNMPIQQISLGARPKGEGGDTWREGSEKINGNFEDLDERVALAKSVADSKTTNATDAHLLNRSNHTGTQSISTILGLQVALDSAASQIDITGNAATATKLQTACTIGGVSFNGTANINLPGVNTAGNQSTSGNAATTTKLQTARSIAISGAVTGTATSFDGSANITITTTAINGSNISTGTIPAARIPTLNQSTTGNAGSATKLQTARLINGIAFDGTGDINLDVYSKAETNSIAATPDATEAVAGKAKIATTAIAQAGTNDTDIITAKKLRDAFKATGSAPIIALRASGWIEISAGAITAFGGANIASITRISAGTFRVTLTSPLPSNRYVVFGSARALSVNSYCHGIMLDLTATLLTTEFTFVHKGAATAPFDPSYIVFGVA